MHIFQAKQAAQLQKADAAALGATNATVYRDRRGKVIVTLSNAHSVTCT